MIEKFGLTAIQNVIQVLTLVRILLENPMQESEIITISLTILITLLEKGNFEFKHLNFRFRYIDRDGLLFH
jgi:hypothetical protein